MATVEEVSRVRRWTSEPTEDNWTDVDLNALIDSEGSVEAATAEVWREKQARYSKLVDTSEAGASRKMSQAFEHAQAMAVYWAAQAGGGLVARSARVHKIVRS